MNKDWIDDELNDVERRFKRWESDYEFMWKNIRGLEEEELTEKQKERVEEIKKSLNNYE
jgi:archaellum component FlaC